MKGRIMNMKGVHVGLTPREDGNTYSVLYRIMCAFYILKTNKNRMWDKFKHHDAGP